MEPADLLRSLPAIDKVKKSLGARELRQRWHAALVDQEIRAVVDHHRTEIRAGRATDAPSDPEAIAEEAGRRLEARLAPGIVRCINATGVVLHTGLGRAVLPPAALAAIQRECAAYTVVSVDRKDGARKRRETNVAKMLCALTGAEAATIVNNNAAATLIALRTLAAGREAIISRGQLVEIGGSFRMPDVFEAAGVKLREVGTTNRTHLKDYARAIGPDTALLLRVHPSNYAITGFAKSVPLHEMIALGSEHGIPVMDDLGAGALLPLPPEPEIRTSVAAGVDLVTCSGDKLIGGPQAGILLGKTDVIDRVRRNPMFRTLRVDKLTLAALEATVTLFLQPDGPGDDHPSWRMLRESADSLRRRAKTLAARIESEVPALGVSLREDTSRVGSGSLPGEALPTTLVALTAQDSPSALARRLRSCVPPVYTRIVDDMVCLDPRTIQTDEENWLLDSLFRVTS